MTDALVEAVARAVYADMENHATFDDADSKALLLTYRDTATAAFRAIEAAGYRVVSVEATDERLTAMAKAREGDQAYYILDMYRDLYGVAIGGGR